VSPSTVTWRYSLEGDTLTAEPSFGPPETVKYTRGD
jgi:hypothetical protein